MDMALQDTNFPSRESDLFNGKIIQQNLPYRKRQRCCDCHQCKKEFRVILFA